jgi:spore cortex formation protein SpoVR/YcgB (stage V sporulation)
MEKRKMKTSKAKKSELNWDDIRDKLFWKINKKMNPEIEAAELDLNNIFIEEFVSRTEAMLEANKETIMEGVTTFQDIYAKLEDVISEYKETL